MIQSMRARPQQATASNQAVLNHLFDENLFEPEGRPMLALFRKHLGRIRSVLGAIPALYDLVLRAEWARSADSAKNPLNRFGAKYFSQADEDGITLEITRRLGIKAGTFAELGVGNGLENNTLILLASGWRGFWIGVQELNFNHMLNPKRFVYFKDRITLDNLTSIFDRGLKELKITELDCLSIDLDGNDYYFSRELLQSGIRPKLFILEYNPKFPPPIRWVMPYNPTHRWDSSDYFGASLGSYYDLLTRFSYKLLCCNAATGVNAFFVRNEYGNDFAEVPRNIEDIFMRVRHYLPRGNSTSPKTIEQMLLTG
jgi:hypothetical protein